MDECVPKRDYVAGRDWPLKGTPKIEWIFALESRRGQKFTQTLRLAETIRLDSGEKPNVLLVGAGEIEPLEYGLAGFYVTAYEMDKTLAQNALQLVEDAGISDSVNVISDQLTPANFPDNNRLVVFDRSLHYHTESEAKSLLLKAMEGLAPGGYLKLRIFLKGSEIFTRPYNNFFYDNKWAPIVPPKRIDRNDIVRCR